MPIHRVQAELAHLEAQDIVVEGDTMRVIALIQEPAVIDKILRHLRGERLTWGAWGGMLGAWD
ncbi:MAG: hypothetical protein IPL60_06840 [Ardenticatenia bacterium]|nr:hypothetical protein [Ardenticatenia bacterium]